MHSEKLLDHFRNPRNSGRLAEPAIIVDIWNPGCGDTLRLSARVEEGTVIEAAFQTRGCTASIGMSSALAEWLPGKPIADLERLTTARLEELVDGLTYETRHAAVLCLDGVKALLKEYSKLAR